MRWSFVSHGISSQSSSAVIFYIKYNRNSIEVTVFLKPHVDYTKIVASNVPVKSYILKINVTISGINFLRINKRFDDGKRAIRETGGLNRPGGEHRSIPR